MEYNKSKTKIPDSLHKSSKCVTKILPSRNVVVLLWRKEQRQAYFAFEFAEILGINIQTIVSDFTIHNPNNELSRVILNISYECNVNAIVRTYYHPSEIF